MNHTTTLGAIRQAPRNKPVVTLKEHIVEIISDSGEGAQRCGQSLGSIAARMGNGIWTVEIIPAEIRPPARSVAGASGNRIRIGAGRITNGGDETDLVIAFNEQVLLGRVRDDELKRGCTILLESMWRTNKDPQIAASYAEAYDKLVAAGYKVIENFTYDRPDQIVVRDIKVLEKFEVATVSSGHKFPPKPQKKLSRPQSKSSHQAPRSKRYKRTK